MQLPERFQLEYTGADNQPHRPVMIHRAIYGTLERFTGCLIEHFAGAFPLWLSPIQVRLLPITDAQTDAARVVAGRLRSAGIRADVDARTFKMRAEQLEGQVKSLARELARASAGRTATVVSRKRGEENPPQTDVEGRITYVDPEGELVSLSVGSDNGLEVGHTLKVFRLDKNPQESKYLGILEVVSVRPHEAVAKPVRRPLYPLQQNDRVASRIVVGN